MRLLLVEDHPSLAEAVIYSLRRAGFAVDHAATAVTAIQLARATPYALVVLDLGLPDRDGLTLLPELSEGGRVPVIILTARDDLDDRLTGLNGGADDYVVKPVEMPELVARCRAVLRRPGDRDNARLHLAPLTLDTINRNLCIHEQPVLLGRRELAVLEQLMKSAGRVVPRRVLEESVYTYTDEVGPNALEAVISRLRRSLLVAGCALPIVTVRGVGWMLAKERPDD